MRISKRKSWRKIPTPLEKTKLIRKVCVSMLVLELAFFVREFGSSWVLVSREESITIEAEQEKNQKGYERTYGIRFRLEEGLLDFYRKEEVR